jgi:hypothetical protein
MRSWRSGNGLARFWSGRFLKRPLSGFFLVATFAAAQTPQQKTVKKVATHHVNEFMLAGLRPGRDTLTLAKLLYKTLADPAKEQGESVWDDTSRKSSLMVSYDQKQMIETIRVNRRKGSIDADCFEEAKQTRGGRDMDWPSMTRRRKWRNFVGNRILVVLAQGTGSR